MQPQLAKIKIWISVHRKTSIVLGIFVLLIVYGTYRHFHPSSSETRYVIAKVERGNIVASISGTGQVSASNQVDLKSKVSADLIYINAIAGQEVKSGALIAKLDPGDAGYELETAELSYQKLVTIDPDDLRDAQNTASKAHDDLTDAYVAAGSSLTGASTNMSDVLSGINDLRSGYLNSSRSGLSTTEKDYLSRAEISYFSSNDLFREFLNKFSTVSASTSATDIEAVLDQGYQASIAVAQSAKYAQDAVVYLRNTDGTSTAANTAYTSVTSLVSEANSAVSNLSSSKSSISSLKRQVIDADAALKKIQDGPDSLDVRAQELSVRQKQEALSDYYVRAPFDGIIASVASKVDQNISSGTVIATLITKQKLAEISLNEVDAAKVKVGQKATLTFDALPDLSISGVVAEIDSIGTVSQGVVTYDVKISFDTQDETVKPGMSVSAAITTDMKQDVLLVPNSAVKSQGSKSYIESFHTSLPKPTDGLIGSISKVAPNRIPVQVGLANDSQTEIVSGVNEGEEIVTRTIVSSKTTTTAPSLFGGSTGNRTTGGVRTGTR